MPDEPDSWLETLGVTGLNSDTSAGDFADESSDSASDSAAAGVSDTDEAIETDITGGPGDSDGSTLVMDDPIGVLQLLSSQGDSSGLIFNVTVASSTKDPLLLIASATGQTFATAKISQGGSVTILQNASITALSKSG